jgi:tetratricopeptide (TPR) repeat protein
MPSETRSARSESAISGDSSSGHRTAARGVFRKEGEFWTVGYAGKNFRLKDTKGLGYLAHLLRHPGVEFHVLDLFGGLANRGEDDDASASAQGLPRGDDDLEKAGLQIARLGDAGEMLDDQAKASYRKRLSELREELDEAKELGNVDRAEQAEQEIEALTHELSRAVGLGGRNRRAASASERARQSITKTIKAVLERIAQSDGKLGDLFVRCVRTGTFCSYVPDPNFPIAWEFTGTDFQPREQQVDGGNGSPTTADQSQPATPVLEVSQFSLGERTPFAGREAERDAIRALLDRASKGGQGAVIMVGGGAGVGKTRLAMEMAEYASHKGFGAYIGHCYEREEPFPYLPFAEIIESALAHAASLEIFRRQLGEYASALAQVAPSLRRVFPDIPEPLDLPAQQRRRYLFQSLSESVARAAKNRPMLFILDDLQWSDESTLGLLIHLANRVPQFPLVIIGTYRDGYTDNNPALVRSLEELIRHGVRPLRLGGLSRESVVTMLRGLSNGEPPERLVEVIFEESQGNPFFIEEVYRHLVEEGKVFDAAGQFRKNIKIDDIDVPENVRLVIGRRLERFDENEKRVLAAAAMIGRSFSFRLLTEVSQIDADELFTVFEKAQRMGIIIASSEGPEKPFTFAHELVRQTLLAGMSLPRKQQMHAAVAGAIELLYPRFVNERAAEITDHLLKAGSFGDSRRLVRYMTLAGKNALESAAFEEARRSFRSALSYQGALEPREKAELLASLAIAELSLEHWDAALASLGEALEIYTGLGDREMIGSTFAELADTFIWVGRFQDARETVQRGLEYLGKDVSVNRARLLSVLGQASAASSGREVACNALREALDISAKLGDPMLEARVLGARSIVNLHFFNLKEAAADGLRSEELSGSESPPWQRALQLRVLDQTLLTLGRVEEALKIADVLEPLARQIGQGYSVALCLSMRAWIEFGKEPDLAKLASGFNEVSKFDAKIQFAFYDVLSEVQLSLVDFLRGDWETALSHAQSASDRNPGMSSIRGFGEGTLFRQMAYAGDREDALAILEKKRALLPVGGRENVRGSWWMLALVIEGLVMLGERAQAAQLYPLARELLATGAVALWPILRFAQTVAAMAGAAGGEWKAADEHFKIALEQAEAFPDKLQQAEIRRFRAMMLLDRARSGDRTQAKTLLAEAAETYKRIGMPRHVKMVEDLLN